MLLSTKVLSPGVYRFVVSDEFSGLRLDQYLAEASADLSRTLARRLIEIGGVHLSARRMRRCSEKVSTGDKIEVYVDALLLDPAPLSQERVIYRDQDLIVIDKPAGMPTQPTPARSVRRCPARWCRPCRGLSTANPAGRKRHGCCPTV